MKTNSKEFKDLQAKWYKKLKDSGFEDCEQDPDNLKFWSAQFFKSRYNDILSPAKAQYYRLAGHFLHSYPFADENEKICWSLHSNGVSMREITDHFKELGNKTYYLSRVQKVINRLAKLMIEHSNEEQL